MGLQICAIAALAPLAPLGIVSATGDVAEHWLMSQV